jgi:DNA-binding NtrC family response regulator
MDYPWPGNIRELQNVIERSVILCETENFSVDESWLSRDATSAPRSASHSLKSSYRKRKPSSRLRWLKAKGESRESPVRQPNSEFRLQR